MKTVVIEEKSGAPNYASNKHVALLVREDSDYFYIRPDFSIATNEAADCQYPKYAWKVSESRESHLGDYLVHSARAINRDGKKFVYSSYPFSCGLQEAFTHTKGFVWPDKARVAVKQDQVTITLDPIKGSGKRKKLVIKLWTA